MRRTAISLAWSVLITATCAQVASAADANLTELGQGIAAYNQRDFRGAVNYLKGREVPRLSDYVAYYLGSAEQQAGQYDDAISLLAGYRQNAITASPLAGKITILYARLLLDKRDPTASAKALEVLQADYKNLPQPDGGFAMALAYEAQGEKQQAALAYQTVYYEYPNTELAAQAWTAIERLHAAMDSNFPKATAQQKLDRCEKWIAAKQYHQARTEYVQLVNSLTTIERDDARIGVAVSDLLSGDARAALRDLKSFHAPKSPTEAKRLYYVIEAARKVNDDESITDALKDLGKDYPQSVWRLKALISAGNYYLVTNDRLHYTPIYKAAADVFPADSSTAYAHWKVTWDAWLDRGSERVSLLKQHIERYPSDASTSAALYFLARNSEEDGKPAEARAYYERIASQYPHFFYATLARERMTDVRLAGATPDADALAWLNKVEWPPHREVGGGEPNAPTKARIERANLLNRAGLTDLADAEVRFGAKAAGEQPYFLALDLAGNAESPFRALRVMKSLSTDYLSTPTANASPEFWRMLFPMPYRDDVVRNANERGLDPYHVAALIRQESEFNPSAKSHANAYGLMQLIPSTGRMLGRQQGLGAISTWSLLQPGINIRLGTEYLKQQLANWNDDWYKTLAAYNAGPGRVKEWLSWSTFREPAEFVESIPFTETREYVQAVLRNADFYRELYAGKPFVPTPQTVAAKPVPPPPPPRKATQTVRKSAPAGQNSAQKRRKSA